MSAGGSGDRSDRWRTSYRRVRKEFLAPSSTTNRRRLARVAAHEVGRYGVWLDAGAGDGNLLGELLRAGAGEVLMVEYQHELLRAAPADLARVVGSVSQLPVRSGSADVVVAMDVLHHLPPSDVVAGLAEFHRVLRPGGALLVFEPVDTRTRRVLTTILLSPISALTQFSRDKRRMVEEEGPTLEPWLRTEQDLAALVGSIGFDVELQRRGLLHGAYRMRRRPERSSMPLDSAPGARLSAMVGPRSTPNTSTPGGDSSSEVDVSIVIPVRDAEGTLGELLGRLTHQIDESPLACEIVVSDNGSTDRSAEVAASLQRADVRVIDSSDRGGASHARNVGAAFARGSVIMFIDADDDVGDHYVDELVGELSMGTVHIPRVQAASRRREPIIYRTLAHQEPSACTPTDPGAGSLAASFFYPIFAMMREDFVRIGGFDETILAGEDLEFSLRARAEGMDVRIRPDAVYSYFLRSTLRDAFATGRSAGHAGRLVERRLRDRMALHVHLPLRPIVALIGRCLTKRQVVDLYRLAFQSGRVIGRAEANWSLRSRQHPVAASGAPRPRR